MTSINMSSLDDQNNSHMRVRQTLINSQPHQQQPIPVQQIINPPLIHPPIQHNLLLDIPVTQNHFPLVPISKYKQPLELWMLLGCGIEMVWLGYCWLHVAWVGWYGVVGFWRHNTLRRTVRFWGELVNVGIWLVTYVYVFSGSNNFTFPLFIILENLDYFFIGANVTKVYYSFFSYILLQYYADLRLYIIRKKLKERRSVLVQTQLKRFAENQKKHSLQLKELSIGTQESVEENMMSEEITRKDINSSNIQQNTCLICLSDLGVHKDVKYHQTLRLYCNHRYHYGCLKGWIESGQDKCPTCKRYLVE